MDSIKTECAACGGTGLYRGMAEPAGVAVVCVQCKGTGCFGLTYKPFVSRQPRTDVQFVHCSKGSFIMNCGPTGNPVTYADFLAGKMPKEPS